MYIDGQPYSDFKAISLTDGKLRIPQKTISTTDYSVILKVNPATLTSEKKLYMKDGTGSLFVHGYHTTYGTVDMTMSSNIAAYKVATGSVAITGLLTTSIILISPTTSAATGSFEPFGATCQTAGKALVQYAIGAGTSAVTTVSLNYVILHPQTS